jgi:hypothetical protein
VIVGVSLALLFKTSATSQIMVEATQAQGHSDEEETQQKNFVEDPAILEKFRAAAVITDGMSRILPMV